MTDKELRRLSRGELLEMLIRLTSENEELKRSLDEAQKQLQDRTLLIGEAGSIAEAALKLNGIFDAAENSAKQYLENTGRICREKTDAADTYAEKTRHDADEYSEMVRRDTDESAEKMRADADDYSVKVRTEADRYLEESREKVSEYWDNVIAKATVLLSDHNALAEAVNAANPEEGNERQQ